MPIGQIGKYERLEILGHGASGIVYLAWDTLLRRNVALKEIRVAGPELEKVLSEARVLDRLRHPHIIEVHSVDLHEGVILLDMELVRGKNLAEVLRARLGSPMEPTEAVRIVLAVLDALAFAHERRILHKDIKPANILIGDDGTIIKLTDFGLAEALGTASVADGGGTYPYMAPEDYAEKAASDWRSDLWAMGVVLYELLSGSHPFPPPADANAQVSAFHACRMAASALPHVTKTSRWPSRRTVTMPCAVPTRTSRHASGGASSGNASSPSIMRICTG